MPVVSRQWAAISHFQEKLVNGSLEALRSSDIKPMVCCFAFQNFLFLTMILIKILWYDLIVFYIIVCSKVPMCVGSS